ncbi:RseA family anti-sigma factor [Candidatus Berkiella aquae]|uniref:Anti sigma-E protein RseA N-terminal domain-containing protein n=1 Tax=Candidatus Berkiella aquae TaxID=295108 RepID=A0A0Q9YMZ7_9GAMM|nr:RseA family anti-sigma factor [Candidatus Berkiella aquae]MCS5711077.1 hypothetical protein [Candidatus Berkiella aquae]
MDAKDVNDNREHNLELLSAMIDDELSIAEKNHLLTQIKADAVLQEKWRHFYIVKTIMRKKSQVPASINELTSQMMIHASEESHLANLHHPEQH